MHKFKADHIQQMVGGEVHIPPGACKIGVYLSGGIDSAIILHHLVERMKQMDMGRDRIVTYTAMFGTSPNEGVTAARIADFYLVQNVQVPIVHYAEKLNFAMPFFPKPRFNIWPLYLAEQAYKDNCNAVFIGEGSDELFGGYAAKDYLQAWADSMIYIMSTYRIVHEEIVRLPCIAPFMNLYPKWQDLLQFHLNPNKMAIRIAYSSVLPPAVYDECSAPPAITQYVPFLQREFPEYPRQKSNQDALKLLQFLAAESWVKAHRNKYLTQVYP